MVLDECWKLEFRVAWIRVDAFSGFKEAAKDKRKLADSLAERARRGEDFAALARQNSDDAGTRERGGALGQLKPGRLAPALDAALANLEPGQVTSAVRVGDSFFVMKLEWRDESELPAFDEAKNELGERVYLEKMGKARQSWLQSLRRQTHVEIRM